jgi:hypothetical protein
MQHMKNDMTNVWTNVTVGLETHLERLVEAIDDAFENVLPIVMSQDAAKSDVANIPRSVAQTFVDILHHRKDLALHGTEDAMEEFRHELLTLGTDALAPVLTSFIGRYMQDTYHAANMEYGKLICCDCRFRVFR